VNDHPGEDRTTSPSSAPGAPPADTTSPAGSTSPTERRTSPSERRVPPSGGTAPRWPDAETTRVPSWLASLAAWTWRLLVVLVGAAVLLTVATRLALVSVPIIVALVLATFCVPPARWLEGRGVPRGIAAAIVVIGGLGALVGFISLLAPAFVEEVQELGPTVQAGLSDLFAFTERTFGYDEAAIQDLIDDGLAQLQEQGGALATGVLTAGAVVIQGITALALAIVLLFFFVKDGDQIVAWMIARTPDRHRATVRATGRRAWVALSGFVRGTAVVALVDAIGIGIGLAILGIPLVLPIAVITFFAGFIPVVGAFVAGLIAVLVALASTGDLVTTLLTLGVVVLVQQFESNVLQPVIMRRAVSLHPVVILASLTAGGLLVGVIGAFLAVPIAAVLSAVGNELRLRHEAAKRGEPLDDEPHPVGPPGEPVDTDQL
jgi:putative heme transporter